MAGFLSNPGKIIIEVDRESMAALRSMAESIRFTEREDFIEKVCSILLLSWVLFGVVDEVTVDAFERIVGTVTIRPGQAQDKLWGEFLLLRKVFMSRHGDQDLIRRSLEELIGHYDLRVFPEEMFRVQLSPQGSTMMVS
jgi:hypothetical protein